MTTNELVMRVVHALMAEMEAPTYEIFAWRLANAVVLGILSWRVGFPNGRPGRALSPGERIARTLVAAMAGATCVAILVGIYGLPFEVVLNVVYAGAAWIRGGALTAFADGGAHIVQEAGHDGLGKGGSPGTDSGA
ncbi:hypothetical protein [Paraburkholderia sp. J11-2]|uniref:hypothetical protein n=1 Tax=Paraburkholderia sp. J11-2 TaxID=2805431 RepID=UPI002AB700AF|nr:hypothetical protein [Paraburkholderia sp. J11-2]